MRTRRKASTPPKVARSPRASKFRKSVRRKHFRSLRKFRFGQNNVEIFKKIIQIMKKYPKTIPHIIHFLYTGILYYLNIDPDKIKEDKEEYEQLQDFLSNDLRPLLNSNKLKHDFGKLL